jgi:hypothetical protein
MDCAYFLEPKDLPSCGIEKNMGFCDKFEFMCSKSNGCSEFEVKEEESDEEYEY